MDLALGPAAATVGGRGGDAVRVKEVRWRDQDRVQGRTKVREFCDTLFEAIHSPGDCDSSAGLDLVPRTGSGLYGFVYREPG